LKHELNASWGATKNPVNPRDYVVPDFGVDENIIQSNASLKQSETALKHVWTPTKDGDFWTKMPAVDANS